MSSYSFVSTGAYTVQESGHQPKWSIGEVGFEAIAEAFAFKLRKFRLYGVLEQMTRDWLQSQTDESDVAIGHFFLSRATG